MSVLGLHFALTDEELSKLQSLPPDERFDYVTEVFEVEKFGSPDCCETDKSWAYIHSAFNGTDPDGPLEMDNNNQQGLIGRLFGQKPVAENPARFAIMGYSPILVTDDDYIGLVDKGRVSGVAEALEAVKVEKLGELVRKMHTKYRASGTANDAAEYAMSWYDSLTMFYLRAASSGKNVIFTVSY